MARIFQVKETLTVHMQLLDMRKIEGGVRGNEQARGETTRVFQGWGGLYLDIRGIFQHGLT